MKDKANNAGVDHKMPADAQGLRRGVCEEKGSRCRPGQFVRKSVREWRVAWPRHNAKLIPHITHTVTVTGDTMETGGKMMIHAADVKMVSK